MEISGKAFLELLDAIFLEDESEECQVESFDSVEDLIASIEDEIHDLFGCGELECEEEDCDCEEEDCDCEECSYEHEEDELENLEESLAELLERKRTDEEILYDLIVEQEKYLEDLYSRYNKISGEEECGLFQEQPPEEISDDVMEMSQEMDDLVNDIEENLLSIDELLDDKYYGGIDILLDDSAIRDLKDIRTLTFLAKDILNNLFERSGLGDQ